MSVLKVFGNPMSTCTRKVLMTLIEKNQPCEFISIDLSKGEHKAPEHLQRHPFGVVPVLEDDNFRLYESRAIIRYLDHKFPNNKLTPADNESYGRMEQWIGIEQAYFSDPALQIIKQVLLAPKMGKTTDHEIVNSNIPKVEYVLDVAEKTLSKQQYFAGDVFSLAEITWMPYVEYLLASGLETQFTKRTHVLKWWQEISQRPSWIKVKG